MATEERTGLFSSRRKSVLTERGHRIKTDRERRKNHHGLVKQTQSQPTLERSYLNIGSQRTSQLTESSGMKRNGMELLLGPWKDNNATVHGVTDCAGIRHRKKRAPRRKSLLGDARCLEKKAHEYHRDQCRREGRIFNVNSSNVFFSSFPLEFCRRGRERLGRGGEGGREPPSQKKKTIEGPSERARTIEKKK